MGKGHLTKRTDRDTGLAVVGFSAPERKKEVPFGSLPESQWVPLCRKGCMEERPWVDHPRTDASWPLYGKRGKPVPCVLAKGGMLETDCPRPLGKPKLKNWLGTMPPAAGKGRAPRAPSKKGRSMKNERELNPLSGESRTSLKEPGGGLLSIEEKKKNEKCHVQ